MDKEKRREYNREHYNRHREEILEKAKEYRARYKERHGISLSKKCRDNNREYYNEVARKRYQRINTEEYRASRRTRYAEKHANDPMTEHRQKCLDANTPEKRAKSRAMRDMQKVEQERAEKLGCRPMCIENFILESDKYYRLNKN